MSVTGLLMFFHLDSGLNKLAHQWLSWVMIGGVATHAIVNWPAFKRYFTSSRMGRAIIGVSAVVLALTFVSLPGQKGPPPQVLALRALTKAPIAKVAPLAGRPVEELIDELAKAGINLPSANASIDSAAPDRGLQAKAIAVIFGAK
ncbi:hypothetical protein B1812_18260 [Methylocystis bryophila]|uniref:DUF4405 domain-containing protein n=2 Tax=Methylocystis bryophila TaxID=655015 RepID=A0A1W6N1T7_9HYPH|nr:hypothetical protein B1812_18260 [Methylocystis bryophila]